METRQASHAVKPGETLSSIARRNGLSAKSLAQHNRISDPNSLRIGQVLSIPGKAKASTPPKSRGSKASRTASGSHKVKPGETLSKIARQHGVSVANLMQWNGISDPSKLRVGQAIHFGGSTSRKPTSVASIPKRSAPQGATHVLQKGETLSAISRKHGITVAQLMKLNGITDPTRLAIGQKLSLTHSEPAPVRQPAIVQQEAVPAPKPAPPKPTTPVEAYKSLVSGKPSHSYHQHTVRPGDTLHSISKENNISVEALRSANGLGESNFIRDGQPLKIPSGSFSPSPAADRESVDQYLAAPVPSYEAPVDTSVKPLFEVPAVPAPRPPVERQKQYSNHFGFAPTPTAHGNSELLSYTVGPSVEHQPIPGEPAPAEDIHAVAASFSTTADEIRRLNNLGPDEPLLIGSKITVPASGLFGH